MNPFHRLVVPVAALLCLAVLLCAAGLLAACGGQTQEPGPADAGQTESETAATTPAVQPAATEPAASAAPGESPLPTATEAPEAQTGVQPVSPIPIEITPLEPAQLSGEVPQDLLQAVIEDLLGRLDASRDAIARDRIAVEEAGAVVWRDGSLGCPQPGMMYTQALVPGYQIVLRVGEETYDYHASEAGYFVLCEGGLAEEPLLPGEGGLVPLASPPAEIIEEATVPTIPTIPPPSSAGLQQLVAQVKEDLALRLSMSIEQIDLVELSPVVWPDGALGCPEPGVAYTQVQVEGLLIRLRAGKRIYPYHSGGGTPPFLCEQAIEEAEPQ